MKRGIGFFIILIGIVFVVIGGLSAMKTMVGKLLEKAPLEAVSVGSTPFVAKYWDAPPFTPNNDKTAKLLWSKRWAIEVNNEDKCSGGQGKDMLVYPETVVFVKFLDETKSMIEAGTLADRRKIEKPDDKWRALMFTSPGKRRHASDISIAKAEQFVVCNYDKDVVIHVEARSLPPKF